MIIGLSLRYYNGKESGDYEVSRYKRGTVDSNIVQKLNKDTLNRDCLTGTWELVTEYDSGYDGNGVVDIDFPFRLPRTLNITPKNADALLQGNYVMKISADGKLRPFSFELSEDNNAITFTTMEWFKGEWVFSFTYTLKQ